MARLSTRLNRVRDELARMEQLLRNRRMRAAAELLKSAQLHLDTASDYVAKG